MRNSSTYDGPLQRGLTVRTALVAASNNGTGACFAGQQDLASGVSALLHRPSTSASTWATLPQIAAPRPRMRFVLLMREPFALATSFYLYHKAGREALSYDYSGVVRALRVLSTREGVLHAASFLLRFELPAMCSMHAMLL